MPTELCVCVLSTFQRSIKTICKLKQIVSEVSEQRTCIRRIRYDRSNESRRLAFESWEIDVLTQHLFVAPHQLYMFQLMLMFHRNKQKTRTLFRRDEKRKKDHTTQQLNNYQSREKHFHCKWKQWKFALHGAIQSCEMRAENFYACVFYNRIYIRMMCTKYYHLFTRNDLLGQMIRSFQRSGNFLIILHSNWARVCSNYDYKLTFHFVHFCDLKTTTMERSFATFRFRSKNVLTIGLAILLFHFRVISDSSILNWCYVWRSDRLIHINIKMRIDMSIFCSILSPIWWHIKI